MNRCNVCVMPDTRPDVPFVDGTCQACITYANRPHIDWEGRKKALIDLLDRHNGECIVPSSGGKDSTAQVMMLQQMGARVLVVTAGTCHLTHLGRQNIDNLARHANTIELNPNKTVRAKLNRLGLELVGDISWPEHVAIFTQPWQIADALGYGLVFYGENPQNQYGGPPGTEEAMQMTRRWRAEFGGFLGLRPADMIGKMGLTQRDISDYELPEGCGADIEAHFLGQYLPWDSHINAGIAIQAGMQFDLPSRANWWAWENLDNAQTGLHDHLMYRKYGYGRGCAQISVDVRTGRIQRKPALEWVEANDGAFPFEYAGVELSVVLGRINVNLESLTKTISHFTNWDLFTGTAHEHDCGSRPIIKETA